MKTSKTNAGLKVKTSIKAGGLPYNHNRNGLKVKSALKACGLPYNHSRNGLKVKTGVKGGEIIFRENHSRRLQSVR